MWTSSHSSFFAIVISIHVVPPLDHDDLNLKYCLICFHDFGTCVPVFRSHNYEILSKERTFIVSSNFNNVSTSWESFCWRLLISFFGVIIFTNINTYVVCALYFFFYGGVTIRVNITSGYFPGSVPSSNTITPYSFPLFGSPVSCLPPYIWFFERMGSFVCCFFDPLIFLLPFIPVSILWVLLVPDELSNFFRV